MSDNAVLIACITILIAAAMFVTHSVEPLWGLFLLFIFL